MEENSPIQGAAPTPQKKGGGMKLVLIGAGFVILLCIICSLTGVIIYLLSDSSETDEDNTSTDNQDQQSEATITPTPTTPVVEDIYTTFEGDAVTAELPADWEIIEYFDGDGTDMMVEGVTYEGLTSLEVLDDTGTVVFEMDGVNGIGGVGFCDEIFTFTDTDPNYTSDIEANNTATFPAEPYNVIPLAETYTEFELLGINVRRLGSDLYWDIEPGDSYFDPGCGLSHGFHEIPDVYFTDAGYAFDNHTYQANIRNNPSAAKLLLLDDILDSLVSSM